MNEQTNLSVAEMKNMVRSRAVDDLMDVAKQKNVPDSLLRVLAHDDNEYVRASVALRQELPDDLVSSLAKDNEGSVRDAVVRSGKNLSPGSMLLLAGDDDEQVIYSLACREDLTNEAYLRLTEHGNSAVNMILARSAYVSPEVLNVLSKNSHWGVRKTVAGNRNTPSDTLVELWKHEEVIRYAVAGNLNCPVILMREAVKSHDDLILTVLASNIGIPSDIIEQLAELAYDGASIQILVENPSVPVDVVNRLASRAGLSKKGKMAVTQRLSEDSSDFSGWPFEWVYSHLFKDSS